MFTTSLTYIKILAWFTLTAMCSTRSAAVDAEQIMENVPTFESYLKDIAALQNQTHHIEQEKFNQLMDYVAEAVDQLNKTYTSQEQVAAILENNGQHLASIAESVNSMAQTLDEKLDKADRKFTQMVDILNDIFINIQQDNSIANNERDQTDKQPNGVGSEPVTEATVTDIIVNTETRPRDCQDIPSTSDSGPYRIKPTDESDPFDVYCDMTSNGGGWTVFQKRFDGSENFTRNWDDYENGFGSADAEYWLGLQKMYSIVSTYRQWELRIDLEFDDGTTKWAEYYDFGIGNPESNYRLILWSYSYSGNATDRMTWKAYVGIGDTYNHNDMPFTTIDRDNDNLSEGNCAQIYTGGWWFNACLGVNLNGEYGTNSLKWRGTWDRQLIVKSEMKMKRRL